MLRTFVVAAAMAAGVSTGMAVPSAASAADGVIPSMPAHSAWAADRPISAGCTPGDPASACAAVLCPAGTMCVPSPKQCFTTPCPQVDCVPVTRPATVTSRALVLLRLHLRLL
ncbi:hypothetical protein N5079_18925 [Planotetraspora sp. A-T 1434]|uniref:hypothetical protein n=1 Tax=Planotetraspora sp. A-T 1434 TaxID=2979219 RepID=UPI0021BF2401|nr:hypothetical protein [Planotetraspora sp. A-T 1434]MCT9932278.1 hypothetical protein [Planotetraspora sp. A-T 1434]